MLQKRTFEENLALAKARGQRTSALQAVVAERSLEVRLPLWAEVCRGVPNSVLRSAPPKVNIVEPVQTGERRVMVVNGLIDSLEHAIEPKLLGGMVVFKVLILDEPLVYLETHQDSQTPQTHDRRQGCRRACGAGRSV